MFLIAGTYVTELSRSTALNSVPDAKKGIAVESHIIQGPTIDGDRLMVYQQGLIDMQSPNTRWLLKYTEHIVASPEYTSYLET